MDEFATKKEKFISALGGRKNGSSDSFVFSWQQIKKILWLSGLIFTLIFTLSSKYVFFKFLPVRVDSLESGQAQIKRELDIQKMEVQYFKQGLDGLIIDIRFIREQLERRK